MSTLTSTPASSSGPFALTMAMTALGIETRLSQIREAGPRALIAGAILNVWLIAGGYALTLGIERWLA